MVSRQLARPTERFTISWPETLASTPVVEGDAPEIGEFLLRVKHPLHPECEAGTLKGATYYVTRLFDYHRADRNYSLSLESSSIVRDTSTRRIVGVCLVGGGGDDGKAFGIYDILVDSARRNQGIGSRLIRKALTVLAEHGIPELYLWREDDCRARALYDRLGFKPTGAIE
jgi:ribosomal protein S18 acetylase RimI-like enzyme